METTNTPAGKSNITLSFQMWKIEEGKGTWLSPWPDSSWTLTQPSLGSGQLRGPVHPPALQNPACPLCRARTDPESFLSPPPSRILHNHTSIPITSCLRGPPPQVRNNELPVRKTQPSSITTLMVRKLINYHPKQIIMVIQLCSVMVQRKQTISTCHFLSVGSVSLCAVTLC